MDVILTISFKITAEIEIASYFVDEVYRLCKAYNVCSFINCHEMPLHCIFY